jgi:hypothetical protein
VKRLQIYVEPEQDDALAALALREGTSKAALIRRYVALGLSQTNAQDDPLDELVGRYDADPGSVDDVVYPR